MTSLNIASHLPRMAALDPQRPALVMRGPEGQWVSSSFAELDARSDVYAAGLASIGITRGVRTVLMVPPDLEFFPLVFGIFKAGAVLVLIDPGIQRSSLLQCLAEVEPQAFIGVPRAHLARLLFPRPFRHVKSLVTVGRRWLWGGANLEDLRRAGKGRKAEVVEPAPDETAAVLFTSGSTGIPKGAVYTHGMFDAQVRMIRRTYRIEPGEKDLPTFPLFALFDPALGMTAIIPEMDFRFPARADPARLVEAVTTHGCTSLFGSPALVDNLARHLEARGEKLPSLRRVISAGAPVRPDVLERLQRALSPGVEIFTPFGATESLPVASIGSAEVLGDTAAGTASGRGVCVGRPVEEAVVRIIRIDDGPIPRWSDELVCPPGQVGEITVKGPMVTRAYHGRPEATALAKISDGPDVVHRMGDLGYFDEVGRLWMCGRKGHRVQTARGTLFTTMVEEVLNRHPAVFRTALVGEGPPGRQRPVVLVEKEPGVTVDDAALLAELKALGERHGVLPSEARLQVYPFPFPVDTRHNAKIERERLARWVAGESS